MSFYTTTSANRRDRREGRTLIIDTDAGFDDLMALKCLLNTHTHSSNSGAPPPVVITTIGGVISAPRGAMTLRKLFPHQPSTKVATGLNSPIMPYDLIPQWLDQYRTTSLNAFVNTYCDDEDSNTSVEQEQEDHQTVHKEDDDEEALALVTELITNSIPNGLDILCIGPLTNLANWLDHYSQSQERIRQFTTRIHRIYILGRNHPRKLPKDGTGEFNFALDSQAAKKVLESPSLQDKIHLVTSTVCNMDQLHHQLGEECLEKFIEAQQQKKKKEQSSDPFFSTLLEFDTKAYSLSCDPIAAFAMDHDPDNTAPTTWEQMAVQVQVPSGLVVPAGGSRTDDDDDDHQGIRIATQIDLEEYLNWIDSCLNCKEGDNIQ